MENIFRENLTSGPCIPWEGKIDRDGYGVKYLPKSNGRRQMSAHRWIWQYERGPIDNRLVVDHMCMNRACVNLDHLQVITRRGNTLLGVGASARAARQTHCKWGHEFDEWNTREWRGQRICKQCANRRHYEYMKKRLVKM